MQTGIKADKSLGFCNATAVNVATMRNCSSKSDKSGDLTDEM